MSGRSSKTRKSSKTAGSWWTSGKNSRKSSSKGFSKNPFNRPGSGKKKEKAEEDTNTFLTGVRNKEPVTLEQIDKWIEDELLFVPGIQKSVNE